MEAGGAAGGKEVCLCALCGWTCMCLLVPGLVLRCVCGVCILCICVVVFIGGGRLKLKTNMTMMGAR